jgi:AraC family ethanolamine operon transcriptional activator
MSPKQYLLLRRMHQARQALADTAAGETTVTEIATRFGFWHFGRFAGTYQSIFGEPPSVTLHRPPLTSAYRHIAKQTAAWNQTG